MRTPNLKAQKAKRYMELTGIVLCALAFLPFYFFLSILLGQDFFEWYSDRQRNHK